jgi:hypothetical protein
VEDTEASSSTRALPAAGLSARNAEAEALAHEIALRAGRASVTDVASLGRDDVPPGRDRAVGVPVLVCPAGQIFVVHGHSHAALAREALSAVGLPFDADHPDRTLGQDHGWAMVQAAAAEGLRVQIDRPTTRHQREVLEDLLHYAEGAGHGAVVHWGRPVVWADGDWEENPAFEAASDTHRARRLLARR